MSGDPVFEPLCQAALAGGRLRTAVAYPLSEVSLQAALQARALGLIEPVLVGPQDRLRSLLQGLDKPQGQQGDSVEIVDTPDDETVAAQTAAGLARDGAVRLLMKGSLHTDHFMGAVVQRDAGLRTHRRISHAFIIGVSTYPKPLLLTDAAINIAPTLAQKADIARNAIDLAHTLGVNHPKLAVLCATELVNLSMPATLDAAALVQMAQRQQIRGAQIDGPLAFDNAISRQAAAEKGIVSSVAGDADILLVPDLACGNMLYKALTYLAGASIAGLVLGARVPVLLTSRADSVQARVHSCAVAALYAQACG